MSRPKHFFSEQEKAWILEQDRSIPYKRLTELFNERFGTELSQSQIQDQALKQLKIHRNGNAGRFDIGARPKYKVGDEIIKAGYIWVKVNDIYVRGKVTSEDYRKNWKRKAELVYEKEHGKIPDGMFLVFLDGNPLNCDIENLYPVTRFMHAIMTKNKWYKLNRDFTLAALKYSELMQVKKGAMNEQSDFNGPSDP